MEVAEEGGGDEDTATDDAVGVSGEFSMVGGMEIGWAEKKAMRWTTIIPGLACC